MRDLEKPMESTIFERNIAKSITAVKYSQSGKYIAYGDEAGMVRVIEKEEEGTSYKVTLEFAGVSGVVQDLAWVGDEALVAVGATASGKTVPAGADMGKILASKLLTCSISGSKLITSGENMSLNIN